MAKKKSTEFFYFHGQSRVGAGKKTNKQGNNTMANKTKNCFNIKCLLVYQVCMLYISTSSTFVDPLSVSTLGGGGESAFCSFTSMYESENVSLAIASGISKAKLFQ